MSQRSPLQTSLRSAARWSLYAAFLLVLTAGAVLYLTMRDQFRVMLNPWYSVDFLDYRSVRDLQELVGIDTTHETGREIDAARWLASQLEESGIEANIEDMGDGKANLWAYVAGSTDEYIVLHSHLDTDPVGDLERWEFDPWSAHIEVVWLHARGSFDMKSTIIAQLHTIQELQRLIDDTGKRPRRGIMMLATSSEETGSHQGAQHIVDNRPDLLEGAWALFSEGGVVEAVDINDVKYLGISFGQKRFVDVWYHADSKLKLEAFGEELKASSRFGSPRVTPSVRMFLTEYAPTRLMQDTREPLLDPDKTVADPKEFQRLPPFYSGFFRDEVHVMKPVEDGASGYRMRVVLHLLEDSDLDAAAEDLLPNVADLPVGITKHRDPSVGSQAPSPLDHPAYLGLIASLRDEFPETTIGPYYLSYFANDSQFFRKLGIPSYGFQPFLGVPADSYTVGNFNERIALPTFIEGVERYQSAMLGLANL